MQSISSYPLSCAHFDHYFPEVLLEVLQHLVAFAKSEHLVVCNSLG
jgi:hypothetical protein